MEKEQKIKKTPKWLKALEAQSWQAELLISGLLIAGLLQMPDLFIHWVEGYIVDSSPIGFTFLNIASLLVLAAIDCVILFFAIHFLLRAIWVALLGLNSVFPDGINVESTYGAGPNYWKKAKEKYPNLSAYNIEMDHNCSLIFSLATVTIIVITAISVIILLIYLLFKLAISMFPGMTDYVIHIGIAIYLIFTIVGIAAQYLGKKHSDNPKVIKFVELYGNFFGILFSFYIFQKPVGYITSIYASNVKSKWFGPIIIISSFFLGVTGAKQTSENPIYNSFGEEKYFSFNNAPERFLPFNYENLRPRESQIFTPLINADVIEDGPIKLFIPTIDREREHMNIKEYSLWERINMDRKKRDSTSVENLKQYQSFNRIFLNDVELENIDFQYFKHSNANEKGVLVYIPIESALPGKNVLEIRKNYFSKKGIQKIVHIPFYFQKTNSTD